MLGYHAWKFWHCWGSTSSCFVERIAGPACNNICWPTGRALQQSNARTMRPKVAWSVACKRWRLGSPSIASCLASNSQTLICGCSPLSCDMMLCTTLSSAAHGAGLQWTSPTCRPGCKMFGCCLAVAPSRCFATCCFAVNVNTSNHAAMLAQLARFTMYTTAVLR